MDRGHADSGFNLLKVTVIGSKEELPFINSLDDPITTLDIEIQSIFENAVSATTIFTHTQQSV